MMMIELAVFLCTNCLAVNSNNIFQANRLSICITDPLPTIHFPFHPTQWAVSRHVWHLRVFFDLKYRVFQKRRLFLKVGELKYLQISTLHILAIGRLLWETLYYLTTLIPTLEQQEKKTCMTRSCSGGTMCLTAALCSMY